MKQTAVEWYVEAVEELNQRCLDGSLSWFEFSDEKKKLYEQAKEMEKEQIELAHIDGGKNQRTAVKYYNETFKSE